MNYIKIEDLRPGHKFDKTVYLDENETVFVPANVPIRKKDIERLRTWKIFEVRTEGNLQIFDGEENTSAKPAEIPPSDNPLSAFYSDTIKRVDKLLTNIADKVRVTEAEIENVAGEIIKTVEEAKRDAMNLVLNDHSSSDSLAKNAVNCGLLAIAVGLSLNRPRHKLFQLLSGALLHDVGMRRMSVDIVGKKGGLAAKELTTLRTHPLFSYSIIVKELQLSEDVAQIALQHHERWDGTGYPRGLSGTDILIDARIVSVTDAFEAMISPRTYRNPMMGYEAMKAILSDNARRFDPEILKIFIQTMGLYPLGSLVRLSDGSMGRVVNIKAEAPLRPDVMILIDHRGGNFEENSGPVVNLQSNKKFFIAKALDVLPGRTHEG